MQGTDLSDGCKHNSKIWAVLPNYGNCYVHQCHKDSKYNKGIKQSWKWEKTINIFLYTVRTLVDMIKVIITW